MHEICKSSQSLVDLFVNYDCEIDSKNIFEKMIKDLSFLSMNSSNKNIQVLSLKTLCSVVNSLNKWIKRFFDDKKEEKIDITSPKLKKKSPEIQRTKEIEEIEKEKTLKTLLEEGKKVFEKKPKKGMEFFIEKKILENTPEKIAQFLHNTPLSMTSIGEYLSDPDDFSKEVLYAYVDYMNFSSLIFFLNFFNLFFNLN